MQTSDKAPLFCRFCTSPSFMMDFSLDINFLIIFLIVPRSIWCDSKTRICLSDLRWFEASSTLNPTATKPLTIPSEPFEYRKRRSCCIACECRAQLMQLMDVCHFSGFQLYIVCGGRWFRITSFETKKLASWHHHQQTLPNICIQQSPNMFQHQARFEVSNSELSDILCFVHPRIG